MAVASFEFVEDDPLRCRRSADRLRRKLWRLSSVEGVWISLHEQRICIAYNPVFLDADALGEKLADLGHVVRPVACRSGLSGPALPGGRR